MKTMNRSDLSSLQISILKTLSDSPVYVSQFSNQRRGKWQIGNVRTTQTVLEALQSRELIRKDFNDPTESWKITPYGRECLKIILLEEKESMDFLVICPACKKEIGINRQAASRTKYCPECKSRDFEKAVKAEVAAYNKRRDTVGKSIGAWLAKERKRESDEISSYFRGSSIFAAIMQEYEKHKKG